MMQHLLPIQIIHFVLISRFDVVQVVLEKQDGTGVIVDNDLDDDGVCNSR